jgi:hypothetical protein
MESVLRIGSVQVEASPWLESGYVAHLEDVHPGGRNTCAKIPIIIFTFDTRTTGGGIRKEDSNAFLGSGAKKVTLLSAELNCGMHNRMLIVGSSIPIIFRASQTGQVEQHRNLGVCSIFR